MDIRYVTRFHRVGLIGFRGNTDVLLQLQIRPNGYGFVFLRIWIWFTGLGLDSVFQDLVSLGSNFIHRVQIRFVQDYWIVITM